jgi:hypothetical protein
VAHGAADMVSDMRKSRSGKMDLAIPTTSFECEIADDLPHTDARGNATTYGYDDFDRCR